MIIKMPIDKNTFDTIHAEYVESNKTDFYSTSPYAAGRTRYSVKDFEHLSRWSYAWNQMGFDEVTYGEHNEIIAVKRNGKDISFDEVVQEFGDIIEKSKIPSDAPISLVSYDYMGNKIYNADIAGAGYKYNENYAYYSTSSGNRHGVYQNENGECFAFYSGARSVSYKFLQMLENANVIPCRPAEPHKVHYINQYDENGVLQVDSIEKVNPNYEQEMVQYKKDLEEYLKLDIPNSLPVIVEQSNGPKDMLWFEDQAAYLIRKNDIELVKEEITKRVPELFFELRLANNYDEVDTYALLGENLNTALYHVSKNHDLTINETLEQINDQIKLDTTLNNIYVKDNSFDNIDEVVYLYRDYCVVDYPNTPELTKEEWNALGVLIDTLGRDNWDKICDLIEENNLSESRLNHILSQIDVNKPQNGFEHLEDEVAKQFPNEVASEQGFHTYKDRFRPR